MNNIKFNKSKLRIEDNFKFQYSDLFTILNDPLCESFYVSEGKYADRVLFISPQNKKIMVMTLDEFSNIFRKNNRFAFLNIIGLFNNNIIKIKTDDIQKIDKATFEKIIKNDVKLQKYNMLIKNGILYIYFPPDEDVGKTISYSYIKEKENIYNNLSEKGIMNPQNCFYSLVDDKIFFITNGGFISKYTKNEYIKLGILDPRMITNNIITEKFNKIQKCDIRKGFIHLSNDSGNSKCKRFNCFIDKNILYVFIIDDYNKYKSYMEYSAFRYNNVKKQDYDNLAKELSTDKIYYCINSIFDDFIFFKNRFNKGKYILIKDLSMGNFSNVMEMFDLSNIYYIDKPIIDIQYDNELKNFCVENNILRFGDILEAKSQ